MWSHIVMKKVILKILLLLLMIMIYQGKARAQQLKFINDSDLQQIIKNPDNKLFVISFWASWCPPCVREMPVFQEVAFSYNATEVKFIMVSMDFPDKMDSQLLPFLRNNDINLEVNLMMDTDYLNWSDKVDPSFLGNIPATLFINNAKKIRYFHTGELAETELRSLIDKYRKQ